MTDLFYSDTFWTCLLIGSFTLLLGTIITWIVTEWRRRDIY